MFNLRARLEELRGDKENTISLIGVVTQEPCVNHETYGEKFYQFEVETHRLSGVIDKVPLIISERVYDVESLKVGQAVQIKGQLRSYNYHEEEHNELTAQRKQKLVLNVYVIDLFVVDDVREEEECNDIMLIGYICKPPIYRKTPRGREICDLLLAVHRPYTSELITKSDYIPCICWGKNARYIGQMKTGTKLAIVGKLQSREYAKRTSEFETEMRIAYEVSVAQVQEMEETSCNL